MNRSLIATLLMMICLAAHVFASGVISGKIVDQETGEVLIGANVMIEGTSLGAATDIDGNYRIIGVEPGVYNLTIMMMGYSKMKLTDIQVVEPDEVVKLDIPLKSEAIEVEEVVIQAKALKNTEAALLKDRQKSVSVSDAISSEEISRSGSSDAAEAMTKVTGASVVGGKYVYIRGLGGRYSSTHLNGTELPSADPDKKSFQMDLFPSNLLDNIITLKTFTPDKPGNFSGGTVDITTKDFPDFYYINFSTSASYNSQTTGNDQFLTSKNSNTDWLGFDDGMRAISDELSDPNLELPSSTRARLDANRGNTEGVDLLDHVSKSLDPQMAPTTKTAPINQSYALSLGNQVSFLNRPLGFVVGLTYGKSASFYEDGFRGTYSLGDADAEGLNPQILLDESQGKESVDWGTIFNFGYKLTPVHKISLNTLFSQSGESRALHQFGKWPKEYGVEDTSTFFENRVIGYTERSLYSFQLNGEHALQNLMNMNIKWNASIAQNSQEEPDLRFFANTIQVNGDTTYNASHSGFRNPGRYFRELTENNNNFGVDISIPFKQWYSQTSKIKFGAAVQNTDRNFKERIIQYDLSSNVKYNGNPEEFFSYSNLGVIDIDTVSETRYDYSIGHTLADYSKEKNNYTGDNVIAASYFMLELPITDRFKYIGGVRYETTNLETISKDTTQDKASINENDLLPSFNFVYALSKNVNLRAAYTRTLARPTFREVTPFESFEFIQGNYLIGNPELKRTLIDNFDTRWEWFLQPGEIVALSAFYKQFTNPIERVIIGGTNGQMQFQNVDEATVLGLEVEFRKNLGFLHQALTNFQLGTNFTFAKSTIDIEEKELQIRQTVNPSADDTRPMQGQSPYLLNFDIAYNNFDTKTMIAVNFNTFGERLTNVSSGGAPDVYEKPFSLLNLTASQQIFKSLKIKFSVKNILNSEYKESYDFKGNEFIYQRYKKGITFSLGFAYSI